MSPLHKFVGNLGKVSQSNPDGRCNPWVWGWLALLGSVLLVNVFMMVMAVVSNPGLVVQDYYEQGRVHEQQVLQKIAARNALHWDIRSELSVRPVINSTIPYGIEIMDANGLPLENAKVKLLAYRPADASADFSVVLPEVAPGHYRGDFTLPLKGIWDLIVDVEHGSDRNDFTQRINVLVQ
ncbi:conserved hypothetical protein [Gammaproteobacteria bacterium]